MDPLQITWFIAIAALWTGFLVLEGFDLGVGMHMLVSARGERDRRVMLNTIGPVWDGNEVWLITAGAATFAAFPLWYAALLSALYVPVTLLLLGLILRAVGIEWRGKRTDPRWTRLWTAAIGVGSFLAAFAIGAALAATTTGLPIDAAGDRVGGPFVWFTPTVLLGGVAVVAFCLIHAAAFLALKSDGPVRERAGRVVRVAAPVGVLPMAAWALIVQSDRGGIASLLLLVAAVAAAGLGIVAAWRRREGWSFLGFAGFVAIGAAAIFTAAFPVVLPSTLDPAWSLTAATASSSLPTLRIMSVVLAIGLPLVLLYQGWSYWVFRRRIGPGSIPPAHVVAPAIRRGSDRPHPAGRG